MKHSFTFTLRKALCIVLMAVILATVPFVTGSKVGIETEARTLAEVDKDINECNALLYTLRQEKSSIDKQLSSIESDSKGTTKQIQLIVTQMNLIEAEVELIKETIEAYGIKKASIEAEAALKAEDKDYALELYQQVILYTYKYGNVSTFEMLFESENFADFITRLDSAKAVMEYSASLISDIEKAQSDYDILLDDLDAATNTLNEYVASQEQAEAELLVKKAELEETASGLGISYADLTEKYNTVNSTINSVKAKITKLSTERAKIIDSQKGFLFPLAVNSQAFRISSAYGTRKDPFTGKQATHNGIDIPADYGTKIYASKSGTVTRSEYTASFGNVVVVYHGDGVSTLYAHCSSRNVKVGDIVERGDVIARVGSTGRSTGNHLHFCVLIDGVYVDPLKYISKDNFISIEDD